LPLPHGSRPRFAFGAHGEGLFPQSRTPTHATCLLVPRSMYGGMKKKKKRDTYGPGSAVMYASAAAPSPPLAFWPFWHSKDTGRPVRRRAGCRGIYSAPSGVRVALPLWVLLLLFPLELDGAVFCHCLGSSFALEGLEHQHGPLTVSPIRGVLRPQHDWRHSLPQSPTPCERPAPLSRGHSTTTRCCSDAHSLGIIDSFMHLGPRGRPHHI
jgi:hypothetical protein